jgi:hypothetical protein
VVFLDKQKRAWGPRQHEHRDDQNSAVFRFFLAPKLTFSKHQLAFDANTISKKIGHPYDVKRNINRSILIVPTTKELCSQ